MGWAQAAEAVLSFGCFGTFCAPIAYSAPGLGMPDLDLN